MSRDRERTLSAPHRPGLVRNCARGRDPYAAADLLETNWLTALLQQQPPVVTGPGPVRNCALGRDDARRAASLRRLRLYTRPILRRRMLRRQPCAPRAKQLFPQRALRVCRLVSPALGQLRHQHIGDILEIAGRDRERHIQPVDIGRVEPRLDLVRDLFRRAHHHRPMPPMPTCCATSRTVQTRSGSARVMLSIAVRPASFCT